MVAPFPSLSLTRPSLVTSPGGFCRNNSKIPSSVLYEPAGLMATNGPESKTEDGRLKLLVKGSQYGGFGGYRWAPNTLERLIRTRMAWRDMIRVQITWK